MLWKSALLTGSAVALPVAGIPAIASNTDGGPQAVSCEISPEWRQISGTSVPKLPDNRLVNHVEIMPDGAILWNRNAVDEATLAKITGLTARLPLRPATAVINRGASCERAAQIRSIIAANGCNKGACIEGPNLIVPNVSRPPPPPPPRE